MKGLAVNGENYYNTFIFFILVIRRRKQAKIKSSTFSFSFLSGKAYGMVNEGGGILVLN